MPIAEQDYQSALDFIYSFVDYSLTRNLNFSAEKFDLGRMVKLLELIGNPQLTFPVIHVAGTKGKGSTAALTSSALREAGYKVGFYISPHLQDFRERIQINGRMISQADLVELLEQVKPAISRVERLTTFEITTALGFLYFALQKVNVAVVEVGLGGRLDATNVVQPMVSVITSISFDHMAVLGNTIAKIAAQKAGIIKEGRPVVVAPQMKEAQRVIERAAKKMKAPLTLVGKQYLYSHLSHSFDGQTLMVWTEEQQEQVNQFIESGRIGRWHPIELTTPLLGHHQVENAATAFAALQAVSAQGLNINLAAIKRGFLNVDWPCRFEVLRRKPPVILDSAHNRDSALKLRLALDDYLGGLPVILVFGASEDKDVQGIFAELLPRVRQLVAAESTHPRAMAANKLVELAHRFGCAARAVQRVEVAFKESLREAGQDAAVVVAGSLFVSAAARQTWFEMEEIQRTT